jgi:hypothetical protein
MPKKMVKRVLGEERVGNLLVSEGTSEKEGGTKGPRGEKGLTEMLVGKGVKTRHFLIIITTT